MNNRVKAKDTKYVLSRLGKYLFYYRWQLILAIILTLLSNLFALLGPYFSGRAIDAIASENGVVFSSVFRYIILLLSFYIVSFVLSLILSRLMIKISQKVVKKMRSDVYQKVVKLPINFYDTHKTGDIISRMSYDIDTINASLSSDLVQVSTSFVTVVGSLFMMIFVSPILLSVFIVTIPLSIFLTRRLAKKTKPLFRKRSAQLGEMNALIEELITNHQSIKVFNKEEAVKERFAKKNAEAADADYCAEYYSCTIGPSVNFVNNISLALISLFGAILFLYKKISLGNIGSFVLYSRKFSGPINEFANIIADLQSAMAAAERVFRMLDEEPEKADIENAKILDSVVGNVDVKNLSFGYLPDNVVIKDLSFHVDAGQLIAIVGPTGAGKTTIINLLMRFYDPQEGYMAIDDNPINQLTRSSLRLAYAMVLQDTWLFTGTIYENISYGNTNATIDDVERVCKMAMIHDYIVSLPKGYNTILNEEGVNISKGQKQLLTIARAMLLDAKMLILDEATSNIDMRTEVKINKAMHELMTDKTCFIIAHRLSTIRDADLILVINDGDIVEKGNHQELIERKGFYYRLYQSQFC